jgi:two-component SAPR family response regulator
MEWLEQVSTMADELGYDEFLATEGRNAVPLIQYGAEKGIGGTRFFRILEKIGTFYQRKPAGSIASIPSSLNNKTKPDIEAKGFTHTQLMINNRRVSDSDWRSSRAKEFFFYLLTYRNGRTKEQIIAALWPDLSLAKGTSNLHINLFRARRALYPGIFMFEDGCYKINPSLRIWYDVAEFDNLLSLAETSTSSDAERISTLEQALELCSGIFLAELYNEWIETMRRELENKYLRVLSLLADYYASTGNHNRAITLLEKYVAVDPYEGDVYYRIICWHLAEHNKPLALRTYKQYMKFASNGSDAKSSHEISELYKNIMSSSSASYIQN